MQERTQDPLLLVCSLLNKHGVRYLIVGGHACILHGLVRTTEDVDILIQDDEENFRRVIAGLSEMSDGAARELTIADLRDNVVVKVADEVEVDVSKSAWTVAYADAIADAESVEIDGIRIPFVSLKQLIRSKETYREQDRGDLIRLRKLLDQR
ncbi:MAG: nucleotidyltransferase [bacterium]